MTVAIDTAGHDQSASRIDILSPRRKISADAGDTSIDNADIADKIITRGNHPAITDGQIEFTHLVVSPTVFVALPTPACPEKSYLSCCVQFLISVFTSRQREFFHSGTVRASFPLWVWPCFTEMMNRKGILCRYAY